MKTLYLIQDINIISPLITGKYYGARIKNSLLCTGMGVQYLWVCGYRGYVIMIPSSLECPEKLTDLLKKNSIYTQTFPIEDNTVRWKHPDNFEFYWRNYSGSIPYFSYADGKKAIYLDIFGITLKESEELFELLHKKYVRRKRDPSYLWNPEKTVEENFKEMCND